MAREKFEHVPIPTYEEATASSSHVPLERTADVERNALLGNRSARNGNYQPPRADSIRGSEDSDLTELVSDGEEDDAEEEEHGLRRDMEQMEEGESSDERRSRERAARRQRFTKRFSDTLTSLHLPRLPSFNFLNFRLPSVADQYKPGWPILARLVGIVAIVMLVYGLVVLKVFVPSSQGMGGERYMPSAVRQFVQSAIDKIHIEKYLKQVSFDDHLAGTQGDFFLADYIEKHFMAAELDSVYRDNYEVYLNYPITGGRRVAIIDPPELAWEAALEEEKSSQPDQHEVPAFHGHSRTGNVTGPLIYANYGSREDFNFLKQQGINLNGSIALVKYFGSQGDRALKVKAAELAGAVGCLIYSDPADDGFVKGAVWPDGPWRKSDSIQRGSVSLMSWVVGDVLTPGNASTKDVKRISKDDNPGLNNIPSLPLAWRDAQVLLISLQGKGMQVPGNWIGGVPDVGWWSGDSPTSPIVHLRNLQDENERQPIRNVMARIEGYETPQKTIYVGNHRDAWCFGAVDPGSGTAIQLELVRVFGELVGLGWRPRRSIVFASWDAEEYNLIGSTEHVEERIDNIRAEGVAYLNVDVAIGGNRFRAAASPVFERPLLRALARVDDPNGNGTLANVWNTTNSVLEGLGAGSDYVAFQDLAGCSSLDFGFEGAEHASPYHSCYESFEWMKKFGDQDFAHHVALAQVWALLILELADEPILAFDMPAYAREVTRYARDLKNDVAITAARYGVAAETALDVGRLEDAAALFVTNAAVFAEWEDKWRQTIMQQGGIELRDTAIRRISHNTRMSNFETHLLDLPLPEEGREGGVPGRTQFKHVIFGPQAWSGYEEAYFPGVRDALDRGDWTAAQAQLDIAARILRHAADKLLH